MAGRKIRDEADARACLEAVSASGLARAVWARSQGIDGRSLNAWRLALERRVRREASPRGLFELVALEDKTTTSDPVIVVRHGAFAIEVAADIAEEHLGRVLRAVAAC